MHFGIYNRRAGARALLYRIPNHANISNGHQLIIAVIRARVNYLACHSAAGLPNKRYSRRNAHDSAIQKRDKYLPGTEPRPTREPCEDD